MRINARLYNISNVDNYVSEGGSEALRQDQAVIAGTSTKMPNFLIIGAAKCGTTALWQYLKQHPQIYMSPRKHTRFFAFEEENPGFRGPAPNNPSVPYAIADIDSYHALFSGVSKETAIGEASHSYLYQPIAPERIRTSLPDARLIAILRNPAERAFSHYRQMVRDGREPILDFTRALSEEEKRIRDYWWPDFHYVQIGLYYKQLKRYFELFTRDQIKIYLYEDLNAHSSDVLRDIFQFLGVDDTFLPEAAARYNASGIPKNRALHSLLQELRQIRPVAERVLPEGPYQRLLRVGSNLHNRNLTKIRLSPEVRSRVIEEYFREDLLALQQLLQRDLSAWLT